MPLNPFVKTGPQNLSKEDTTVKRGIPPVPEDYAGYNLPYRGIETHGVEPNAEPQRTPGYEEGRPTVYEAVPQDQEPVPVRIVQEESDEQPKFSTARTHVVAGRQPMQLLGRDEDRYRLLIANRSVDKHVYIGAKSEYVAGNGYQLDAGTDVELGRAASHEVWVVCVGTTETTDDVDLHLLWESV